MSLPGKNSTDLITHNKAVCELGCRRWCTVLYHRQDMWSCIVSKLLTGALNENLVYSILQKCSTIINLQCSSNISPKVLHLFWRGDKLCILFGDQRVNSDLIYCVKATQSPTKTNLLGKHWTSNSHVLWGKLTVFVNAEFCWFWLNDLSLFQKSPSR